MSPSQSIVAFLVLSACALAVPTPLAILKTNAVAQAGVTAAICEALDCEAPGAKVVQDACVAAGLSVGTKASAVAVSPQSPSHIAASAFAGVMNGGNSVAASLYHVVSGVDGAATSVFNTLSAGLIIPALTRVSNELNGVVATVGEVKHCTEVQLEAATYQGFVTLAMALQSVFWRISHLPTLYVRAESRASLHASLLQLRAALTIFVDHLFNFISADLDKINLRAALFLSLDGAIQACA
ncbi:hypothetical protein PGT21_001512 [Puccinia graminis f. sp. tritici]|uniref:Uncharacterized protein n=1 Tax=Puccinia graminis f. sp. tritici TaxID=56615 RepID=A0A5B0LHU0_PUCGR|nr:hypothetical protein PGT21_001512 [Puccinia graminis f. sp. tritici]